MILEGEETTPVEAPAAPAQDAPAETSQQDLPEGEEAPKEPRGAAKRIQELVREKSQAQAMADRLINLLERPLNGAGQPQVHRDPNAEPQRTDYPDIEEYLTAKAVHRAQQAFQANLRQLEEGRQAQTQREAWEKKQEGLRTKYADYDDVVIGSDAPTNSAMNQAMLESDHGAEIAYYLAKNKAESARISKLSPSASLREMGKIEARIESGGPMQSAARVSGAPAPLSPVGGRTVNAKDPEKMSMDEWVKWRAKGGGK